MGFADGYVKSPPAGIAPWLGLTLLTPCSQRLRCLRPTTSSAGSKCGQARFAVQFTEFHPDYAGLRCWVKSKT